MSEFETDYESEYDRSDRRPPRRGHGVQPCSKDIYFAWDLKIPRFCGHFKSTEIINKLNSFQIGGFTWIKYGQISILKCEASSF